MIDNGEKFWAIKVLNGMPEREWRFWSKVDTSGDCWLWRAAVNATGYGAFGIGSRKARSAHRVAYEYTYNVILTNDMHILHSCDNPRCVNPLHLSIGTILDNSRDKVLKGRQGNGGRKLTFEDVRAIRARYAQGGTTQEEIAQIYNLSFVPTSSKKAVVGARGRISRTYVREENSNDPLIQTLLRVRPGHYLCREFLDCPKFVF